MLTPQRILLAASLSVFIGLSGCASSMHDPEEKYILVTTNIKVPYWQTAFAGLGKAGSHLRVKTEMMGPDTFDTKAEHDEFQRAIAAKPTGILVSVGDPSVMKPDIDAAIAKGIPVITMDSDAEGSKRLLFIGTDNYKAGTIGGQTLAKQLNGKGNIVVYTMPDQPNLQQRLHGYQDVLATYPHIKITQTVDIKGDPRIAFDTTTEMVKKNAKEIDGFVCLEALACPEVADVLDREKVTGKVVIAMDTDQRTLNWIQKGMISATIAQKPFTMAFYGVVMLDGLYHNKPTSLDRNWSGDSFSRLPTFVDTGTTLINKQNVDEYLKERESATTPQS